MGQIEHIRQNTTTTVDDDNDDMLPTRASTMNINDEKQLKVYSRVEDKLM